MSVEILVEENIASSYVDTLKSKLNQIIAEGADSLVLDLSKVKIIDSTGIGLLIQLKNSLKECEGEITLKCVSPDILRMLKMMRLDQHLKIED